MFEADDKRFQIEELLFSRTDQRGVIQSCNTEFERVSGFSRQEIIGAPHKIVRHPNMPKAIFHLMWQTIKQDQPIGAYVCNKTTDGSAYWVFATVLPLEDGYISIRLKPTCGYLEQIIPIYEELYTLESRDGISPKDSAQHLVTKVKELGFSDYSDFYCFALRDEVVARQRAMGQKNQLALTALGDMFRSVRDLEQRAGTVQTTFRQTHQIPYNMRLQAGRLEGSDGPISVISANHRQMTQTLEEHLKRFGTESSLGAGAIRLALFKTAVARVVEDAAAAFETDNGPSAEMKESDLRRLRGMSSAYQSESLNDVGKLSDSVNRFGNRCRDMRRMMSGLELTRIMCKIERSKFDGEHNGLDEIVNRLLLAQDSLGHNFDEILNLVTTILGLTDSIQRDAKLRYVRDVA